LTSLARYEEGKVLLLKGDGDYYDDDSPNADLIVLKAGKDNVETPATDIRILCQGKKIVLARQQEGTVALSSYDFKTETETPIGSVESMPKSSFQCSEDDKAGFFSIGDDNKLLVMNLENGSLIRSDIGNGHPKAISPDGTYVFYLPPASNTVTSDGVTTTIIDASTQDSVGYLVETATGTKTEMTQVRRSQVVNFLDNKKLAYVKREGEIKNKMIAFDIENGSSETIAEIDWWWGMPGYPSRNFFASEVSKSYPDRIRELYVYSRESRSNFKIPVEQLVDSQMNWIQVPKGTYAKWKDFADANRATVAASLKENRPPTCTAESYENEMNAGVEMNFSLNVVDSDYEDNNNYYSEFPPFSIIQNPGDRAELSNSYFDGASGLIRSPETDTTQDLTFIFRATDSKGATGDCQMQVHIEAEDVVSCGNGILEEEEEEECDDGNMIDDDECTNACQAAPACGDAILHNREQCDDGNMNNGDGCDNTCKMEAPTGLLAISTSSTSVNLAWADYFNYETGFKIERKTGAGVFIQIIQTAANAISYTDNTGLTPGTGYIYRIRATNLAGDSAYSAVVSVTTSAPTAPAAPSAFTATPTRTSIVLTWTDNATNESSFVIQRKTSTTSYSPLTTLPVDTITYTNIGLPPSTRYYYRIKATNGTGSSVYVSNNATTLP
ncbi:MAG: DUF4215 domain-containing protein, partial [Deltaproteobacteria bacterium]|nr:DUF4215 domain-containing protein [Deltaproteobacteria bacterium]